MLIVSFNELYNRKYSGKVISNLRYADDIVLLATSSEELQELVSRVERGAKEYNMLINAAKTKVMTNTDEVIAITVAGGRLEQVDSCVYLGSKVRNDANCTDEVKLRMAMGTTVMVKLTKMWKNKSLSTLLNCA